MATSPFPPFDFTRFQWRASGTDGKTYQREAFGTEALMDYQSRYLNGDTTLFLGLTLEFKNDLPVAEFMRLAQEAWMITRFEIPTIAATTTVGKQNTALITYRSLDTFGDVRNWAARTFRVANQYDNLEVLRYDLGQRRIPDSNGDMTFVYVTTKDDKVTGLLMHTSHVVFDAKGLQIIMRRLLGMLAQMLAGDVIPDLSRLEWGQEVQNLLPSVSEVLAPTEPREGEPYSETLRQVLADFVRGLPAMYPFRERKVVAGPTKHVKKVFSKEESDRIRAAAKAYGFTVNQLFHAALCLVTAQDNPPTDQTPEDSAFVFYGVVNCRSKRLAQPYSGRDGYPGFGVAVSALILPGVDILRNRESLYDRRLLLALAGMVKAEYQRQREWPSLLAIQGQLFDIVLPQVKAGHAQAAPPNAPFFVGDGIIEAYIDRSYADRRGREVFNIGSIFSSLNKHDPGPFFRVGCWRDTLHLDVDFNPNSMPPETIEVFMQNWMDFARLIL